MDFGNRKAGLAGVCSLTVLWAPAAHEGAPGAGKQPVPQLGTGMLRGQTIIFRLW